MKLIQLVDAYVAFKRSAGMRFDTERSVLRSFCRAAGDADLAEVSTQVMSAFLNGSGPITSYWHQKYSVLNGFYRYVLDRGYIATSPLPVIVPRRPPALTPHIYSVAELRSLLAATEQLQTPKSPLQAATFRTLLLLLYGSGMRVGEALALTLDDVDLDQCLITVRDTKFHKTRWVPIGPKLTTELITYAGQRRRLPLCAGEASAFFATRTGHKLMRENVGRLFRRIRRCAGVHREPYARYQPRLHDIRHTAVVHRVVAWYRAGLDVQQWLLPLSTYLGHVDIKSTQRYLTMTPDLLNEASRRFERYARPEVHHES
jgi:integrase